MELDPANQLAAVPQSDALIDGFAVPEVLHFACVQKGSADLSCRIPLSLCPHKCPAGTTEGVLDRPMAL